MKPSAFKNNTIVLEKNILGNIRLNIQGYNNIVRLSNMHVNPWTVIQINIYGHNNEIVIDDVYIGEKLLILQGQDHPYFGEVHDSVLKIGKGTSIEGMRYITYNSNSHCSIGNGCMVSTDVTLFNTYAHPIIDTDTGNIINKVDGITIGNHCWVGEGSSVLKNSKLPNNCIIGYKAVVSGEFKEEYAAYAGNPARCVKKKITWSSNGKEHGYIDNVIG